MCSSDLALVGSNVGVATGTKVVGVDRATKQVYVDTPLVGNVQVATGSTVRFSFSQIRTAGAANSHGLLAGDVIYIARGSSHQGMTEDTYTVHTVIDSRTFTTTPALNGGNLNPPPVTLHNSIFYAERFTNGPYNIQNPGDQIKVTLNVSLE